MLPHLTFFWDAFWELSADRHNSDGVYGRIPFLAIDRFAERYGISALDDFDRFRALLRTMDAEFREYHAERANPDNQGRVPIKVEHWQDVKASLKQAALAWQQSQSLAGDVDADT